jgi:hypothetical protein
MVDHALYGCHTIALHVLFIIVFSKEAFHHDISLSLS